MCFKVWSRQRHDLPTPGVPSNAAAGDVNPKISNRVRGQTVKPMIQFLSPPPVGGRTGRLILSWSGISEGIAAAGPDLPVTFELNVFISCWPFSSSVYISQLIKYPTVGCHPAPTPPHTPKQPHPTKTRPSKFYEEHGHHKKKRWAVGGQYAHEIKKKKMGV